MNNFSTKAAAEKYLMSLIDEEEVDLQSLANGLLEDTNIGEDVLSKVCKDVFTRQNHFFDNTSGTFEQMFERLSRYIQYQGDNEVLKVIKSLIKNIPDRVFIDFVNEMEIEY